MPLARFRRPGITKKRLCSNAVYSTNSFIVDDVPERFSRENSQYTYYISMCIVQSSASWFACVYVLACVFVLHV